MEITYAGPRMRGSTSTFQEWTIPPLSSNQFWSPNDVIKIMANITQGLVDPYRTHLEFDIVVSSDFQPVGLVQVDNSAQSFISQTVLLSNQSQIERIQQYDTIAAVLTDLGFSQYVCQARSGQGLGFTNIGNQPAGNTNSSRSSSNVVSISSLGPNSLHQMNTGGGFSPIISSQYSGTGYLATTDVTNQSTTAAAFTNTSGANTTGGSWQSTGNWVTFPDLSTNGATSGQGPSIYTQVMGRAMAVRAQYNIAPQNNGYPDAPGTVPLVAPAVLNQTWNYGTMQSAGYSASNPYQTTYTRQQPSVNNFAAISQSTCGISGYNKPVVPQFATGTQQPFVSATIPQVQMQNGMLLAQPVPILTKTFRIPLISAIIGILIPPDQFQLIPAAAMKNFLLQITLNPYAMFTSGYSDVHELDSTGMQVVNMQQRRWLFQNFQWVWHLYTFQSAAIQASIKEKLYKGITISSNMWALSAQYQLPNGSYARNTFQIPVNVDSLAEVLMVFLSNEYQTKSFCRKQFRLSNNITAMQLKANGQWFPLQPITGNAGNPQKLDSTGDNWNYYELLLLSNNFLFNTNAPLPRVNTKNFAVNGRFYDTTDTRTFMPSTYYNKTQSVASVNSVASILNSMTGSQFNTSTALGQCWFHQNRYVGRALYSYTFEPYGHSKGLINGLNTREFRQFDVTFNNSPLNVFPTDQTLLIFSRSNVLVRYSEQGIQVLGV